MNCVSTEKTCNNCGSVIGYKLIHKDVRIRNLAGETYELFHIYFHWCDKCKVDCQSYTTRVCDGELEKQGGIFVCEKCGYSYTSEFVMNQIKIVSIIEGFSGVG